MKIADEGSPVPAVGDGAVSEEGSVPSRSEHGNNRSGVLRRDVRGGFLERSPERVPGGEVTIELVGEECSLMVGDLSGPGDHRGDCACYLGRYQVGAAEPEHEAGGSVVGTFDGLGDLDGVDEVSPVVSGERHAARPVVGAEVEHEGSLAVDRGGDLPEFHHGEMP